MMRSELSACAAASCCTGEVKFDGLSRDYKARLWAVIVLNAGMFAVEMSGGVERVRKLCRRTLSIFSATL